MPPTKPETRSFYELAAERAVQQVVGDLDGALDLQELRAAAVPHVGPYNRTSDEAAIVIPSSAKVPDELD